MQTNKKIAVFTTGRQDWGILRSVVISLIESEIFDIAVIAGGMACDSAFGNIAEKIESEKIPIYDKLDWGVNSDDSVTGCSEISSAIPMVEESLKKFAPDAVMILGDRFETLAIALVATLLKIPIIHLHGGEETRGAMDNQIRHAISKLSHIHFVSHQDHADRLIKMGEQPDHVHLCGAPGIDNLHREDLPDIEFILKNLGLEKDKDEPIFLITYHPPTLIGSGKDEITALLKAMDAFDAVSIFTLPNNDPGNMYIREAVGKFSAALPKKRVTVSALGEKNYWSVLKHCDLLLGNSSSGIIEAPAVPVPVINIGQRQGGRGFAPCVIDVPESTEENIKKAIILALKTDFRKELSASDSRYGDGRSSGKIVEILKDIDLNKLLVKTFYNE